MNQLDQLPWLLRRAQVLAILGCDPRTLRKMVDCHTIAVVKTPGGQRRFLKGDILKLITK